MSIPNITQGYKITLYDGTGNVDVSQASKVTIYNVGEAPTEVSQFYKVVLFQPDTEPPGAIKKGNNTVVRIYKGTVPVDKVYAGNNLTFSNIQDP